MDYVTKEEFRELETRLTAEMHRIEVMFEQLQSQMRFVAETVTAFRAEYKREIFSLEERLTVRIVSLEKAVTKNSEDIQKNSKDIQKNSEDIVHIGAKVNALSDRVDVLTERVDVLTERVDVLTEKIDVLSDRVDLLASR